MVQESLAKKEEVSPVLETDAGQERVDRLASETLKAIKKEDEGQVLYRDLIKLFDHFEAANLMDKKFSPWELNTGEAPNFVAQSFKEVADKYGIATIYQLFDLMRDKYKTFINANPEQTPENQTDWELYQKLEGLRDRWLTKTALGDTLEARRNKIAVKESTKETEAPRAAAKTKKEVEVTLEKQP